MWQLISVTLSFPSLSIDQTPRFNGRDDCRSHGHKKKLATASVQVLTSGLQINPSSLDKRGQVKDYWLCATKHYISLETSLDIQQINSIRLQFILFCERERSLQEMERYFKCHYNPIQRTKLFVRITIIILRFIPHKYIISKIP